MWSLKPFLWAKVAPQIWHLNALVVSWTVVWCPLRPPFDLNVASQSSQSCVLPSWTEAMCSTRPPLVAHLISWQISHWKGLFPSWNDEMCCCICCFAEKYLSQRSHLKFFCLSWTCLTWLNKLPLLANFASHMWQSNLTPLFGASLWWFSVGICKYKLGYKSHDLL